jgi:cysteine desulfurase
VFTAGGSEADNLAVKGAARAARAAGGGDGVVVTAFEHKAVLGAAERLAREGFRVTRVGVTPDGMVDIDRLADTLDERTVLVSVMLVNNEVGTIQRLAEVAAMVRARAPGALLHTDAVQAAPWLDVAVEAAGADLIAVSAHKLGGPKGVGALIVRDGVALEPLVDGGGQEAGRRGGTSNVAGVVAMAAALRVTLARRAATTARVRALRDALADGLLARVDGAWENGDRVRKIPGNVHLGFAGVESEALLVLLDGAGVYAAAGSSCSSGAAEPSHVLEAMGLPRARALASVRLSLGASSTSDDVEVALDVIPSAVAQLRRPGVAA